MYDVVVVGAGFSGSILARKIAEEQNKKVLVVEQRPHIAGNMYDEINEYGILIQKYGPHFLNTNKYWIIEYLSQYTELYEHDVKLLSFIDGKYVRLPFNLKTLQQLVTPQKSESLLAKLRTKFRGRDRVSIFELIENEDMEIKSYGKLLFEKAYKTYTAKQWGLNTEEIDRSVLNRVQMALNYDERYLDKDFQYLPKNGFTKLFENLLKHNNIDVELSCDALKRIQFDNNNNVVTFDQKNIECLIYTGAIDELLNNKYGDLPYRSLDIRYNTQKGDFILPSEIVSYPQAVGYTRKTEYKQFNVYVDETPYTTVATEYPMEYNKNAKIGNLPYYPIINEENLSIYNNYLNNIKKYKNLFLCGRLAEYKYFNMDVVIEHAFEKYENITKYLNKINC